MLGAATRSRLAGASFVDVVDGQMSKPKVLTTFDDLMPDAQNANRGTERGRALLEHSLRQYGAGRSVLADKHGALIAGNKTVEVAAELGLPIRVVETDGHELVVVQRNDLDLSSDRAARELAYVDNRAGELSLDWDIAQLQADLDAGLDLGMLGFAEGDLAALLQHQTADPPEVPGPQSKEQHLVIVSCRDEHQQGALFDELTARDFEVKVVSSW